jgi:hypothetical protein
LVVVFVSSLVVDEIKRIVKESEILKYDGNPSAAEGIRLMHRQGG